MQLTDYGRQFRMPTTDQQLIEYHARRAADALETAYPDCETKLEVYANGVNASLTVSRGPLGASLHLDRTGRRARGCFESPDGLPYIVWRYGVGHWLSDGRYVATVAYRSYDEPKSYDRFVEDVRTLFDGPAAGDELPPKAGEM